MKKEILRDLGLNKYEIKVYITLLGLGTSSAYEISKVSSVPFGRIYDILERLILKGLVSLKTEKPKKFRAISPKIALNSLINKKTFEWSKKRKRLKELIKGLKVTKISKEPIWISKGRRTYNEKVIDYISSAEKESLSISTGEFKAERYGIGKAIKNGVKKGTKYYLICPMIKEKTPLIRKYLDSGVKIRHYPIENLRLIVVDGKKTLIALVDPDLPYNRAMLSIESEVFSKAIRELYLALWDKSKPIR